MRCPPFPHRGVPLRCPHVTGTPHLASQSDYWPTQLGLIDECGNFWSQLLESGQMSQLLTEFKLHFLPSASYLSNVCSFSFPFNCFQC